MTKKNSSGSDKARQALLKAARKSTKTAKRKASGMLNEWRRTQAAAKRLQVKAQDKELTAQWRALRKLGFVNSRVTPAQKHLTAHRKTEIRKAFKTAQTQAALSGSKVVRPLERQVITTTTLIRTASGSTKRIVRQRVKYVLNPHFKMVRSKNKPSGNGFVSTRKGYIFDVTSPDERVTIKPSGAVVRDNRPAGGMHVESYAITGEEILELIEKIKNGKFKLRKNQALKVSKFGGSNKVYHNDSLMLFVADNMRYESTMLTNVFQQWLDATEIRIITV